MMDDGQIVTARNELELLHASYFKCKEYRIICT